MAMVAIPMLTSGTIATSSDRAVATNLVEVTCNTQTSVPTVTATLSNQSSIESEQNFQSTTILSFLPQYFSSESALTNCQKTAASLQDYYNRDKMNYLASDTIDGKPVVCAVERRGIKCDGYSSEILFSLEHSVNPTTLLYDILGKDFKGSQVPSSRTVSRIYTDLRPIWWPF